VASKAPHFPHPSPALALLLGRLLSVEHIDEGGKPMPLLVFEFLDTDLKKYVDANSAGPGLPLDVKSVKVRGRPSFLGP